MSEKDKRFSAARKKLYDALEPLITERRTIKIPRNPDIEKFLKDLAMFREESKKRTFKVGAAHA